MGCGVSDLSRPEITFIAHGIYLYLRTNGKSLQNVNNDALSC